MFHNQLLIMSQCICSSRKRNRGFRSRFNIHWIVTQLKVQNKKRWISKQTHRFKISEQVDSHNRYRVSWNHWSRMTQLFGQISMVTNTNLAKIFKLKGRMALLIWHKIQLLNKKSHISVSHNHHNMTTIWVCWMSYIF